MNQLEQDDDGHWWVIPSEKEAEFWQWIVDSLTNPVKPPEWAVRVNGSPSLVKFDTYITK